MDEAPQLLLKSFSLVKKKFRELFSSPSSRAELTAVSEQKAAPQYRPKPKRGKAKELHVETRRPPLLLLLIRSSEPRHRPHTRAAPWKEEAERSQQPGPALCLHFSWNRKSSEGVGRLLLSSTLLSLLVLLLIPLLLLLLLLLLWLTLSPEACH